MQIALFGYGKMGKTIEALAKEAGDEVVLIVDVNNRSNITKEQLKKADVVIEFTRPESAFENVKFCLESGVPVVSGTTAWLERLPEAKTLVDQHQGAFLYASNFSLGVNLFFALNEHLATMMKHYSEYQVRLHEVHHTQKLDAPSGTAITLAESVLEQYVEKKGWVNELTENPNQLSITSERIDAVPGTHQVIYQSGIDTISIEHIAHTRKGFAQGALVAAKWLIGKSGFFDMKDVLGLK